MLGLYDRRVAKLRPAGWCLAAWFLAFAAGCGTSVNRAEVSGTVTIAGQPVTQGVQVVFTPRAPDAGVMIGVTNDRGRYTMYHKPGMKGLLSGTYTVSIRQPGDDTLGPGLILPPELAKIKIPKRYRTGASKLECVVGTAPTTFDIDVRTD
ncbi:hypothetical protein EBR56_04490 [bacterium]|nr:hypothetical protein [bacterium]